MTVAETADRPGKTDRPDGHGGTLPDDGRARTREVKLACLFTQTDTRRRGPPGPRPRLVQLPGHLRPRRTSSGPWSAAEARRRGADHVRQLVVLGDGAAWIWNLAGKLLPAATQIVDIYHAREHLHALAATLAFIVTDPAAVAQRTAGRPGRRRHRSDHRRRHAQYPLVGVKATDRDKALTYFRTNTVRMRYAHYRKLGMFIGSGNVEAGCKAVIGQRLKLSGMRWTEPGATGILTLRCQQASGQWDQIWTPPHNQIHQAGPRPPRNLNSVTTHLSVGCDWVDAVTAAGARPGGPPGGAVLAPAPAARLVRPRRALARAPLLDDDQRLVVQHPQGAGPLVVLGAPGTGRTTTLVEAVVARVERDGVAPDGVLVLSATRLAAAAARDRIAARLQPHGARAARPHGALVRVRPVAQGPRARGRRAATPHQRAGAGSRARRPARRPRGRRGPRPSMAGRDRRAGALPAGLPRTSCASC